MILRKVARRIGRRALEYGLNANNRDMNYNGEAWIITQLSNLTGTAIDVGANAGHWSKRLKDANPKIKIVAVEAVPEFAEKVTQNFGNRAMVANKALSDEPGTLTVYRAGGGARSQPVFTGKSLEPITIECVTGDDLVADLGISDVSFIKIDTDGFDLPILKGFFSVAKKQRPMFQFEYSRFWIANRHFLKDASDYLDEINYRMLRVMPRHLEEVHYAPAHEVFMTCNFLAMPKERKTLQA